MRNIILMAETGSDITPELAAQYGIEIVPMHVNFDEETLDDGAFPVEKITDYYYSTKKLPKTSGSTVADFEKKFDEVHAKWPEAHILYLAYSAITTCSYQSAIIAAEDRDYVTAIDTKQVSVGQGAIVVEVARLLQENPEMPLDQVIEKTMDIIAHGKMCFVPDNLEFLHAGGRVSNAAFLGARILNIHPCVEILEGKLIATKKFRGKMKKVVNKLITEYAQSYHLRKEEIWFVYTIGLADEVKEEAERTAIECGFKNIQWIQASGVITTHGGPAAFGLAGIAEGCK